MADSDSGLHSIADQRYYHFILLRDSGAFSLRAYWTRVGDIMQPGRTASSVGEKLAVQHRKLRSNMAFARGVVSNTLSETGTGRAPYYYDLFAAQVELRDATYFLLGFPFVGLAMDTIGTLLASDKLMTSGDFVGVDVPKLVHVMEKERASAFDGLSSHIVGLQFVVTDDKSLTAVRLGGDDPLSAEIYLNFLRRRVASGFVRPDLCVLACEREEGRDEGDTQGRSYRARLRIDGYGNFRFYAHLDCANVRLIPYAIGQLRSIGCLRRMNMNPLLRARREED
jgi:hypothetical protein